MVKAHFHAIDVVLVWREQDKGHKEPLRWISPSRIVFVISVLVYEVEQLLESKIEQVNSARPNISGAGLDSAELSTEFMDHVNHCIFVVEGHDGARQALKMIVILLEQV